MILSNKIVEQLLQKWGSFADFNKSFRDEARGFSDALGKLSDYDCESLISQLAGEETPGALPTPEFDAAQNLCLDFAQKFTNHQEARAWAHETLLGQTTFAVDGSQIKHDPQFSIPVAAVQVAWFVNKHTREGSYTKDIAFEILTPEELLVEFDGERAYSEQRVNVRRFEFEIETLCSLMKKAADEDRHRGRFPVAFFDSSFVISFVDRLQDEMKNRHIKAMLDLLKCSKETGVPVVGYVDNSHARDLANMVAHCFKLGEPTRVHDSQLISSGLSWGSRTPLFVCARGGADRKQQGVLDRFEEFRRGIGFVYLKSNVTTAPARLEIPLWVYERGLIDRVIDVVRAELIVGNGYPYVIETADAAAVLTSRDRDAFYAVFQRFANDRGVEMKYSQKATSKQRRR